ncbi:MAG: malto-oligosyltrehalose trehalohydrolase [Cellvibrionaceae bacterium]
MSAQFIYELPFGAQPLSQTQTRFGIWAPAMEQISLAIVEGDTTSQVFPMGRGSDGFFSCVAPGGAGTAYFYRLPNGTNVPDPASRLQRDDVHGPSVVVNPSAYQWRHGQWTGRPWQEMVIYEIHPGCWGGFKGIEAQLSYLAELGITAIELMPIADFSGRRNWGYDGVLPFAPDRQYGSPQALKELIDAAHDHGICVYLDVVYNHFGPDGNYLHLYAPDFFNADATSPWGAQIDFSRRQVRNFFTHNALYWLLEYRFDGLRFDAVHAISEKDWLDEMAERVRLTTEANRRVHLVLENERNRSAHLENDFDAQWNDDAHNVLHLLLTNEYEGYYANFIDQPTQKLARALESGFVYQGEPSPMHNNTPRGSPSGHLAPCQFVLFLQNHDQVGNRAFGERLTPLCNPLALRAAATLQLLSPQIPLMFMDEERGSTNPFLFFTDFQGELAAAVRDGRRREFRAFSAFNEPEAQATIPDPNAEETFRRSSSFERRDSPEQRAFYDFYRRMLSLRQEIIVPHLHAASNLDARVIGEKAVSARWQLRAGKVLRIIVNLSERDEMAEPVEAELVAESRDGAGKAARQGTILNYSTSVFLEPFEHSQ